jgi:hypothetical protein
VKKVKYTKYQISVYNENLEKYNTWTGYLGNNGSWYSEPYCDGGTWAKEPKGELLLFDECIDEYWFEAKVKHVANTWFGPGVTEEYEFAGYSVELIKE